MTEYRTEQKLVARKLKISVLKDKILFYIFELIDTYTLDPENFEREKKKYI